MTQAQSAAAPIVENLKESILDIEFWKEFQPQFSIAEKLGNYAFELTSEEKQKNRAKLVREGYVHLVNPGMNIPYEEITKLFTRIVDMGLPAVFSFVYDEMWMLSSQIRNLMRAMLNGEYAMLPDIWGWHVSPGQAGWKPHRDKTSGSLFPDKSPKSLTVWMPMNQAHPLNGCMYLLPADRDKAYGLDGSRAGQAPLPDIRALPADAGDVLLWTQHVYHWGGHSADQHDLPPRMSVAFEFQRSDVPAFNEPLLDPMQILSFEDRLALIGKQIMQYRHMYGFHANLVAIAENIRERHNLPAGIVG